MFRNLEAEQARLLKTNTDMAELLGVTRVTYEFKKKSGKFNFDQIRTLCNYFSCTFEYLFATDAMSETGQHDAA